MPNKLSYKPKAKHEITTFVNARQKTFLKSTEIYLPKDPYEKLIEGYEALSPKTTIPSNNPNNTIDNLERSKRRAYTSVKDLALSNDFQILATFTFKSNRLDPDLCRSKLHNWFKRQRKQDKTFQYIVVAEHHADGKALHFHALIANYTGKVVRAINPNTGRPHVSRRRKTYDFPNYTLGHSSVYYIGDTQEDRIKSTFYILKYLKKDLPPFKNKKRYWASRGLKRPVTIDNPDEWFFNVTPDKIIETEYGKFLYFDNDRIREYLQ